MKPLLAIAILVLGVTFGSVARAGDAAGLGDDEISLKDGGMLRGTIIAVEPGKEATIVVKGKEKTIAWSKIDKVERGKYKEGKTSDADKVDVPKKPKKKHKPKRDEDDEEEEKEELTEPVKGAPFLHIQATYPDVQLTRVKTIMTIHTSRGSATGFTRENVCAAPCDQIVDARDGAEFFFTAPNMTPSSSVKLTQYDGEIEARVQGGSLGRRTGGVLMMLGGITSGVVGIIVAPAGIVSDIDGMAIAGGVALGIGVGLIIPGALLITSSRTTVDIVPRTAKSAGVRFQNGMLLF